MNERDARLARAICAGIIAFDLAFVSPAWSGLRVLWYLPVARRWTFAAHPVELAMDWYGRSLLAIAASAFAFALALIPKRPPRGTALAIWTAWVTIATCMTLALQVFQLVTRHATPEPLPSWYVPR